MGALVTVRTPIVEGLRGMLMPGISKARTSQFSAPNDHCAICPQGKIQRMVELQVLHRLVEEFLPFLWQFC